MKPEDLRALTNHFQDVRLISLRNWKAANEITPRDPGGPYMVGQEGYDPADLKVRGDEFVLGRSGQWLSVGLFLKLPQEMRRAEFVFGTAAEVMKSLETLPGRALVWRTGYETSLESEASQDELNTTFLTARKESASADA
jgi:hypothetical protein